MTSGSLEYETAYDIQYLLTVGLELHNDNDIY